MPSSCCCPSLLLPSTTCKRDHSTHTLAAGSRPGLLSPPASSALKCPTGNRLAALLRFDRTHGLQNNLAAKQHGSTQIKNPGGHRREGPPFPSNYSTESQEFISNFLTLSKEERGKEKRNKGKRRGATNRKKKGGSLGHIGSAPPHPSSFPFHGKIGYIALKEDCFRKIPLKDLCSVK